MDEPLEPQPLLPRIGMIWFFIVALIVAIALGVIRYAEQGGALATALVFSLVFFAFFFLLSGVFFLVAFLFGATVKAVEDSSLTPQSPFSDGTPPEQLLPPRHIDDV